MMPNSFPEQARETDTLDASSDDPLPMGLYKFLKNTYVSFSLQIRKEKGQVVILRLWPFNRFIHWVKKILGKLKEIQKFSGHFIFQKYIKGVAGLSGIF